MLMFCLRAPHNLGIASDAVAVTVQTGPIPWFTTSDRRCTRSTRRRAVFVHDFVGTQSLC